MNRWLAYSRVLLKKHGLSDWMMVLSLSAFPVFLYVPNLPMWWISGDDTQILKHAASYQSWDYFFIPSAWQELSQFNLTPMVTALYDFDLYLFGLNPVGFYVHHLAMFVLLSWTTYRFLTLWLSPLAGFVVSALFSLSPCYSYSVNSLMTRHYVEGLFWVLWAAIFYTNALRKQRLSLAYWGALFYLLATLNKEIYVPFVLLLPVWPERDPCRAEQTRTEALRKRIPYFFPFFVVTGAYCFYRRWMLAEYWIGGYGAYYSSYPDLSRIAVQIGNRLLGDSLWLTAVVVPLGVWGIIGKDPKMCSRLGFASLLILFLSIPLITVLPALSGRHLFLPTFILLVAAGFGLTVLWHHGFVGRVVALSCILLLFVGYFKAYEKTQVELGQASARYATQGAFLWEETTDDDALFAEGLEEWYLEGLYWLRSHVDKRPQMGSAIINFCCMLYTNPFMCEWGRLWRYDPEKQSIIRVEPGVLEEMTRKCLGSYRSAVSLEMRFWQDGQYVAWELGPYETGTYFIVSPKTGNRIAIPRTSRILGRLENIIRKEKQLHICYTHPDGWTACSTWSPQTTR